MTTKARRTRDGEDDPYGSFRDDVEVELSTKLRRALAAQLTRLMAVLGDDPGTAQLDEAFWQAERELLVAAVEPTIEQAARLSAEAHGAHIKALPEEPDIAPGALMPRSVPVLWDEAVIASHAADWAREYAGQLIRDVTSHTMDLVQQQVANWIRTPGLTIGDLRRSLLPAFGEKRAQRIAVTETTRAFVQGQRIVQDELRRGGLRLDMIWHTSADERVCEVCSALDGKAEGDGWAIEPPAHPNCRCWTTLRLPARGAGGD